MNDSTFSGLVDTPLGYSSNTFTIDLSGYSNFGAVLTVNNSGGLGWTTTYGTTIMGSDWDIDKCGTDNCRKAQLFIDLKIN